MFVQAKCHQMCLATDDTQQREMIVNSVMRIMRPASNLMDVEVVHSDHHAAGAQPLQGSPWRGGGGRRGPGGSGAPT